MTTPRSRPASTLGALAGLTLIAWSSVASAASATAPSFGDYLAATVALHDNDFSYAAEHLLRALAADPRNPGLRQQAFLASALAGRPEAVRLASGLPGDEAASLLGGDTLALAGRWDEAARLFANIPSDGGLIDMVRPLLVAWSEFGAGRPELALGTLEPLETGSRLPGLYALHAAAIADLGGRAEQAARDFGLVRTTSPLPGLETVRIVASYEARHGRLADAEALIRALADDTPVLAVAEAGLEASLLTPPIDNARDGLAEAYLAVAALIASEAEGSTSALLLLRDALALDPALTGARLLASDLDQSLGVPASGLAILAAVRPADPLAALVQLRRAELDEVTGNGGAARAGFAALASVQPGAAEPWRELGELLSEEGDETGAAHAFDQAIADTPSGAEGSWQLLFDRAVALDRSNRWRQAEADLDEALRRSPDQPYVLNYLGYSYAERGQDLAEARSLVERALSAKPGDAAFLDSLGWIMLKQNDVAGGVRTLERAAEMTPEDPTVNYHLGVGYWRENRRAEAEESWQQALILHPDAADRPRIEARLRMAGDATADASPPGSAATPRSASP